MEKFKNAETGHAVLVSKENLIIFHPEKQEFLNKYAGDEEFQRLLSQKNKWTIVMPAHGHKEKLFIASADIDNSYLKKAGIEWLVNGVNQKPPAHF